MREKLLKLMKSEKLSSSRLAEILEIQPSSISHILSGRNKPSFDFLVKILRRFPTLNPDWLLLDADQMYRSEADVQQKFDGTSNRSNVVENNTAADSSIRSNTNSVSHSVNEINSTKGTIENIVSSAKNSANIERVIILYSDKSFEAYTIQ